LAYKIEFTTAARKSLAELPKKHQRQIIARADLLTEKPRPPIARQLQGYPHLWRIQCGSYGLIYTVEEDVLVVVVVKIGHRREIYRRLDHL